MNKIRVAALDFHSFSSDLHLLLREYFAIPTGRPRWKKIRECCERLASVAALNEKTAKKRNRKER